ncbi:myelin and lymphocyte protein-like [Branchiostoma floridae x Branchiostoma belcheri]
MAADMNLVLKVLELIFGLIAWALLASVHGFWAWGGQHWVMFVLVTCWVVTLLLLILNKAGVFSNDTVDVIYAVLAALCYITAAIVQCVNADRHNYWHGHHWGWGSPVFDRHAASAAFAVFTCILYIIDAVMTFKGKGKQILPK